MQLFKCVLSALIHFTTVSAFIPWNPPYACLKEGTCTAEKRSIENGAGAAGVKREDGVVSFNLIRRIVKSPIPRANGLGQIDSRFKPRHHGNDLSPRATVTAQAPTQSNSIGVNQDGGNNQYFIEAYLGSNNTPLLLLMDTGGSVTWVMANGCTQPACLKHNNFGPANSTTSRPSTQSTWSVNYGSGSVNGTNVDDTIAIANLKFPITIGLAYTVAHSIGDYDFDGIWGLSQVKRDSPNFLQSLVASKQLKANIFAVHLSTMGSGPNDGQISFGGTDPTKYIGDIKYTAASTVQEAEGYWTVPLDDVGFGSQQLGPSALNHSFAIIDTGTTYLFASPHLAQLFFAKVPGSAYNEGNSAYSVPCDTTTPLTLTISGVTYSIAASDWVGPKANGVCYTNIGINPGMGNAWLLGDVWLRQVYTVFDFDKNQVGIAFAKGATPVASPTGSSTATGTGTTGPITLTTTIPNAIPTGSSSQSSGSGSGFGSGLVIGQSTSSTGTAAAQTTTASPSATHKNAAIRSGGNSLTAAFAIVAVLGACIS